MELVVAIYSGDKSKEGAEIYRYAHLKDAIGYTFFKGETEEYLVICSKYGSTVSYRASRVDIFKKGE